LNLDKSGKAGAFVFVVAGAALKRRNDLAWRLGRDRWSRAKAQGFPGNMGELGFSSEARRMRDATG